MTHRPLSFLSLLAFLVLLACFPGIASADSIAGRIGMTGRFGIGIPTDASFGFGDQDPGLVGTLGMIWGAGKRTALDAEISYSTLSLDGDGSMGNSLEGKRETTELAVGLQFRPDSSSRSTLYMGIGAGVLYNSFDSREAAHGADASNDWLPVGYVKFGVDRFFGRNAAFNMEVKGRGGPSYKLRDRNGETFSFHTSNIGISWGMRLFF